MILARALPAALIVIVTAGAAPAETQLERGT